MSAKVDSSLDTNEEGTPQRLRNERRSTKKAHQIDCKISYKKNANIKSGKKPSYDDIESQQSKITTFLQKTEDHGLHPKLLKENVSRQSVNYG